MEQSKEMQGLCATCIHVKDCLYRLQARDVIWFCEEFDDFVPPDADIISVIEKHQAKEAGIIQILQDIQSKYSYLPQKALRVVSERTGRSLTDIYGVATFYKAFSLKPRGRHLISVCLGTACHVRGGPDVAAEFEKLLKIKAGSTTPDREFSLETVNCLGACALGPIVVVDGHYFSHVNINKVPKILADVKEGLDKIEIKTDKRVFPVKVSCPRCNHSLMDHDYLLDGYPSIRVTTSFGINHGWLRLSSLYGSYTSEMEFEIPLNQVVNLFCPYCHTELIGADPCPECDTDMVPLFVREGGTVQICPRRGCRGHMLNLV